MRRLVKAATTLVSAVLVSPLVTAPPASAASCPPASVGGPAVGWLEVDGARVPLKNVTYPAGGVLNPPATALAAGVSTRHRPLLAESGSTVIAWHVRYGRGCFGALNPLLDATMGSTFDIVTASGGRQTYRLVERTAVKRGQYEPQWFRTNGPAQVSLFTCTDLRNGRFAKTMALIAEPVG